MEHPSKPVILEGRALVRSYRLGATEVPALRGVDLSVGRGEFLVLQGPSGSGKTTLINMLGLLDRPDEGEVLLEGAAVTALDEESRSDLRRDRLGFIFQTFNLVPVMTAVENVAFPMLLQGQAHAASRRQAALLLERVGLADKCHARPDLLSGGERQRVAVARALANDPSIVLADEPTASLDSTTASGILDLLQALQTERGVTLIVATHDARVVARAGRVIEMRDGTIAGQGSGARS